jgi:outer membrane receptor protein involved in Fe transport
MQTLPNRRFPLGVLLTFGLMASLNAQTAPATTTTTTTTDTGAQVITPSAPDQNAQTQAQATNEEPIVLETFTVDTSTDKGYVAVNSLAGGRNNTPLAITPTSVSSLTEAFIDDLQLTNVNDALKWTMNAIPGSFAPNVGSGSEFNSWGINLRGAGTGPQGGTPPTVNYFPIYAIKDFFNVDRFELDLGPNSILFGIGSLGGVAASYTKKPRFDQDFTQLDLDVTSFGGARAVLDVNQRVSILKKDDFGIRIDLLADRDEDWRKEDLIKRWGASIATTFKVSDNTSVRLDMEVYEGVFPQYAENLIDHYSQWDHVTASQTWGAAPTGGTANSQSMAEWGGPSSFQLWIPSQGTLMNWGAGYAGTGLADGPFYSTAVLRPSPYQLVGTDQNVPALPSRDFTVGPTDGTNTLRYYTLTAYIDQKINENCEFELSAYRFSNSEISKNFESPSNVFVDINKQMPNGMANPEYGQLYSDMFIDQQDQDHSVNEFRAQLNYHFDTSVFNVPVKQWMSVSGGDQFTLLLTREYIASYSDNYPEPFNTSDWTEDMIWAREYYDHPNTAINLPNVLGGHPVAYQALPFNWFDHDLATEIKYIGAVSQTRLWDDRLNLTLGIRRDDYYSDLLQSVRPPYGLPYPEGHSFENIGADTYDAGLVGFITKTIAATYNFSENLQPIGGGVSPSLFGSAFGPATGKANSVGLRFSTNDGKYYVVASYYKDVSHGIITNDSVGIQGIWNDYYKAGGTAMDIGPAGTLSGTAGNYSTQFNYADTEDVKDTGYELSAVANPTPNWRFQASYAIPKSVVDNDLPNTRVYFADHLTEWTSVAAGTSTLDGQVAADLRNAETELTNTAIPATNQGLVKSTFNLVVAYMFTDTWAKGFSIGAGATALGEQETSTGGALFSPAYTTYIAFLKYETSYHTSGKRLHVTYQLNVDNLTNNQNLVFTGYNQSGGVTQGANYYFLQPRRFTLSLSTKF